MQAKSHRAGRDLPKFELDGYRPATVEVGRQMQGGILALETAVVSLTKLVAGGAGPDTIQVYVTTEGRAVHVESSAPGVSVHVQKEP